MAYKFLFKFVQGYKEAVGRDKLSKTLIELFPDVNFNGTDGILLPFIILNKY